MTNINTRPKNAVSTSLGLLSIIIWSASVVLSRLTSTELGKFTSGATIYLIGGALACLIVALRPHGFRKMFLLPKKYLFICGPLFIIYIILFYVAIGLASTSQATIVVGLINYFWPTFIIVFSIPILGRKANWMLAPGVTVAMLGVFLAATSGQSINFSNLFNNADIIPFMLAFIAAISWGLYTNFCQKYGGKEGDALPLFLLACGIILFLLRLTVVEQSNWTNKAFFLTIFTILFPVILAYSFWDQAIRKGNALLVSALSYFTPVLSTILTSFFLGVSVENKTWLGCIFVTIGAILCKLAFPKNENDA